MWAAVIPAVASLASAYLQSKQKPPEQPTGPMFGAPRLAPGVYRAARAAPPRVEMPNVGPDPMAAQQPQAPEFDAKALLEELLSGQGKP